MMTSQQKKVPGVEENPKVEEVEGAKSEGVEVVVVEGVELQREGVDGADVGKSEVGAAVVGWLACTCGLGASRVSFTNSRK
jgi:hypothetical protein